MTNDPQLPEIIHRNKQMERELTSTSSGSKSFQLSTDDNQITVISVRYDSVIRQTLCFQIATACLAALFLDGGIAARVVGVALLSFWLSTAIVVIRRPWNPTPLDLRFIQWGFWPMLVIAVFRQAQS